MAISPNNHEVHIFTYRGGNWEKTATLDAHLQRVTGLDWAPESNRIVTCGADRNAYVWVLQAGIWKPTLVILRINRAATCVKWSPFETKFAVGSGARLISVCYFEQENDWWVSKHIKKPLRSTVTSLDWHPNNVLIGCGSTDFKARIFSAYIKEVDEKPSATVWGKKMTFGNLMAEFCGSGAGWVQSASFSHSGDKLVWVANDSSVNVANGSQGGEITTLRHAFLPMVTCTWVGNNSILAAGYDCCPMLFRYDDHGEITFVGRLDQTEKSQATNKFNALKHFQHLDNFAQAHDAGMTKLDTLHQNTITQVTLYRGDKNSTEKFSTSGIDGQLILWDFKSLESSIAGLRI